MKIKFGTLLAMLLCGACFVTHAVPIASTTYESNYGGVYDIQCTVGACDEASSIAWTFGYTLDHNTEEQSEWEYTLSGGGAPEQTYVSSPGSVFRSGVFGSVAAQSWQLITAPALSSVRGFGLDVVIILKGVIPFDCVFGHPCDGLAVIGHFSEVAVERLSSIVDAPAVPLTQYIAFQALGSIEDPNCIFAEGGG